MGFKFENAEESPGLVFWQVSTLWRRNIKNVLDRFDITHTQYVILSVISYLSERGERVTQTEISNLSMIDVMTISRAVRLLEKKRLIERYEDSVDSRAKRLQLTESAKKILSEAIIAVEEVDEEFFLCLEERFSDFMEIVRFLRTCNNK